MKKAAFILRPIEPGDVDGAMRLSNAEGWNQTLKDWKFLIETPGNFCVLAESAKKIIGTTAAINYSNQVAWIGMVLVDIDYRGMGVSKSLLTNILKKIESFKSVKLDATPAGQEVYKKFGFEDEYLIARMTNLAMNSLPSQEDNNILPEPIKPNHLRDIIEYDAFIFGAKRTGLIESLVQNSRKAWLLKRNNSIAGFVLGREGNKYYQVGPVFASNTDDAKILIAKALEELINQPVVVDVPHDKQDLVNWLTSIGFTRQRDFVRMYKKENPFPGIRNNQYLMCGPEFG